MSKIENSKENVHFMSKTNEWSTPQDFFDKLDAKYNFTTDLACLSTNKKCDKGLCHDLGIDSLKEDWTSLEGNLWCNPPYGRGLRLWVKKAYESSLLGATIVMLIPSRTDTSYWHDFIFNKDNVSIDFLRGRLKFGESKNSAPFPSAVIVFKGVKS